MPREITLYAGGDWSPPAYFGAEREYTYYVSNEDEDIIEEGTHWRVALNHALDEAWVLGYRRVTLSTDDDDPIIAMSGYFNSRRLHATARRKKLLEEHNARIAQTKIENRRKKAREYRRLALYRAFKQNGLTPETIREFYARWKKVTGYMVSDDNNWKYYLAQAKQVLVAHVVDNAKWEGWNLGWARGGLGEHNRILYIDTPLGQVSFHIDSQSYSDLPYYSGQWSGIRNSDEILTQLYAKENPAGDFAIQSAPAFSNRSEGKCGACL